MGVIAEYMKSRYTSKPLRFWRLRFVVFGCLGLLVAVCFVRGVAGVVYNATWITESRWAIAGSPDGTSPRMGVRFSDREIRPASSPIPTIPGLEYSLPRFVAFVFYDGQSKDSLTVLSVRRRFDSDSEWVTVVARSADIGLSPDPHGVRGALCTPFFEIAPQDSSARYIEFELRFQVKYAGQDSTPSEQTVVYRFQREERSGLRTYHL